MRRYNVEFLRPAEEDLLNLYETIAAQAGIAIAGSYVDRIEAACLALQTSPLRGASRDDILPGLRTIGFERRATIVFRIRGSRVSIVRVFYGGQDFEHALRGR
jgi:toxin ParE1/3/4